MLGKQRRLAVMAEGSFTPMDAKTALGVLRYRTSEVVAVIDSGRAGRTCDDCVGVGGDIPVVAGLEAAAAHEPDSLLLGIAPQGGTLPESWRRVVAEALLRGWDVLSGLHVFLADDPELSALARAKGCTIHDVRRPPATRYIAARRAASGDALIVLTVGSDCNVGKMTVALELDRAARAGGLRSAWAATGQTGIVLRGRGVPVDRVVADFIAGVAQILVQEEGRDADVVVVEGQGAIAHPGYAGVTLGLLYGVMPDAMVLAHTAGRERYKRFQHAIPPLPEVVALYESLMRPYKRARVAAIALNTSAFATDDAHRELERASEATGLPAGDVVRFGAEPVWSAVRDAIGR